MESYNFCLISLNFIAALINLNRELKFKGRGGEGGVISPSWYARDGLAKHIFPVEFPQLLVAYCD